MSRSVADATRFTATSPHAFTKCAAARFSAAKAVSASSKPPHIPPQPKPTVPPSRQSQPGLTETPAQKVARLRAAHAAKRASEISAWDRVVVRGRNMADSAHRITVIGMVLATIVAGGVTVFSLGDMIIYNRKKKREWYDTQQKIWEDSMQIALEAEANGTATDDQMLLLNRERAYEMAQQEKKNRAGVWTRIKGLFGFEGLKAEETPFSKESLCGQKASIEEGSVPIPPPEVPDLSDPLNKTASKSSILQAVEDQRRQRERQLESQGQEPGSLDKMAEDATETVRSDGGKGGWLGWFSK